MRGGLFIAGWIVVGIVGSTGCAKVGLSGVQDGGDDRPPSTDTPSQPVDSSANGDRHDVAANAADGIGPPPEGQPGPSATTCAEAKATPGNAGCSFYAVPAIYGTVPSSDIKDGENCLAMFVVNPGKDAVKLQLNDGAARISLGQVARLPRGTGKSLTYAPFDEATGLPPGEVALLFLWDGGTAKPNGRGCPSGISAAAVGQRAGGPGSGVGNAFRLTSERPVVAYQMHPYNAATAMLTSATLLLPAEAWGKDHFVATPTSTSMVGSFAIAVASEAGTTVSFKPRSEATVGGTRVPAAAAGSVVRVTLNAGEFVRFSTEIPTMSFGRPPPQAGLGGSPITADKPIGVFGGTHCFWEPANSFAACDGVHQQVPPLSALGNYYAAVGYRERWRDEPHLYQITGAVDGTLLSYGPYRPQNAPTSVNAGQVVKFYTTELLGFKPSGPSQPFIVRSQDAQHPFYLAAQMTGGAGGFQAGLDQIPPPPPALPGQAPLMAATCNACPGDPELVNVVPLQQYMTDYTFFTDPSYPETNLVVVRRKDTGGRFADVKLECASTPLSGWKPLGDLEYTHLDLVTGNFQKPIPTCDNGRHHISSAAPFAVTIWGWGQMEPFVYPQPGQPDKPREGTGHSSYAYPAGSAILRVNDVPPIIP